MAHYLCRPVQAVHLVLLRQMGSWVYKVWFDSGKCRMAKLTLLQSGICHCQNELGSLEEGVILCIGMHVYTISLRDRQAYVRLALLNLASTPSSTAYYRMASQNCLAILKRGNRWKSLHYLL